MGNGVCAVIVTYNRKDKLVKCLQRLRASTVAPQRVLIVDNASTDGTPELVRRLFPEFGLLVLEHNVGGSGGFEVGMRRAYASGYDYVWLFDDDAYVAPDCLQRLLDHAHEGDVIVPIQIDQTGRKYGIYNWNNGLVEVDKASQPVIPVDIFAFVGPLIHRRVIARVGFPRSDFFISADDTEYALRIKNAGLKGICVLDAVFYHDYGGRTVQVKRLGRVSIRSTQPAWKNYYNIRNEILMARALRVPVIQKLGVCLYIFKKFGRSSLAEVVYEENFLDKWKYTALGVKDGLLGRSGKRVLPVVK
ncbi:glycosyl transferase, family 2 (plasmid) [Deinococcus geothermalis DSM 11300]|uniref:Glycosyl transferase, family 2 n=1 Tax=Deinococcus geothermalis (strain DSM 11300 / CIP 105573 / AG-3a) TaxID=319795 RepID=Q1J350_DEIGD|nr:MULTISPECIES: glycosyltransferase family 2 protein [Deinococcus]ABF44084.1 glycosyl transferase, family 2 [Deinococcus geothermalis DSM 11300]TDE86167.1 glycosyltransferase [Deinococcus sp. S9]